MKLMKQWKSGIQRNVNKIMSSYGTLRQVEEEYDYEERERKRKRGRRRTKRIL
jgi:hypothetical protein